MRDRLIELLCGHYMSTTDDAEKVADLILADGWMRPPCKVGNMVYCRVEGFSQLLQGIVRRITTFKDDFYIIEVAIYGYYAQQYTNKDIGKTVFLTKEEAEQALKGGCIIPCIV